MNLLFASLLWDFILPYLWIEIYSDRLGPDTQVTFSLIFNDLTIVLIPEVSPPPTPNLTLRLPPTSHCNSQGGLVDLGRLPREQRFHPVYGPLW